MCGREMSRHCPECGSSNFYGLKKIDVLTLTDHEGRAFQEEYRTFRCRRCGAVYNDWKWKNDCGAPRNSIGRSVAAARAKTLDREQAAEALEKDRMGFLGSLFHPTGNK